jgi:hypothetical protein
MAGAVTDSLNIECGLRNCEFRKSESTIETIDQNMAILYGTTKHKYPIRPTRKKAIDAFISI